MHYCPEIDTANITAEEWNVVYKHGGYNGEGSGPGSLIENNKLLIQWLQKFIDRNFIQSIVDVGCGDFQWMPVLLRKFPDIEYIGIDCTQQLIDSHSKKYPDYTFACKDITANNFEHTGQYDLVLCKDVLQHSMNNPRAIIEPIDNINSKYKILITPAGGPGAGSNIKSSFKTYSWITDYQSDEEKSIYILTDYASYISAF